LAKYYSDQASKTEFFAALLEQFRADDAVNPAAAIPASYVSEPGKSPFDSYRSVINVSIPYTDSVYFNESLLDRDAAYSMSAGIDSVRNEWNRVIPERKRELINKRLNQYQANINSLRNPGFGVSGSEIKECIAWEERQRKISGCLFPSLIESCSINTSVTEVNPNVGVIDVSPLEINAKITDGIAFDSDLVSGVENMAVTLSKSLVGNINNKVGQTIKYEMDILRRNGIEYANYRYKIGTRIGLTLSEFKETFKNFFLSDYQKRNPEAEAYFSYMQRDFDLKEQLVQDLYWAQKQQEYLNTALINEFMACSLGNGDYPVTGAADPAKIINSNKMVMDYIKDVFSLLLNTQANIRFVKTESMEEIWGPAFALSIGIGLIPGVGLMADILIGIGIDIASCLLEKNLKKDDYAATIVQLVTYEEQKLLQNINRYGGNI